MTPGAWGGAIDADLGAARACLSPVGPSPGLALGAAARRLAVDVLREGRLLAEARRLSHSVATTPRHAGGPRASARALGLGGLRGLGEAVYGFVCVCRKLTATAQNSQQATF